VDKSTLTAEKLMDKYGFAMTAEQLTEVLGLAKDTVLRMLQRQDIKARKAGAKWIIATERVAEYLTSGEPKEEAIHTRVKGKKLIV
jgi:excisionase family DNA binding protein